MSHLDFGGPLHPEALSHGLVGLCINLALTGDKAGFIIMATQEPETKWQSNMQKTADEPAPIKAKTIASAGKRMVSIF